MQSYNLSLILVSDKEFNSWSVLLPHVQAAVEALKLTHEILVAVPQPDKNTRELMEGIQCKLISAETENYGILLRKAIHQANGDYIMTIDADQSQPGELISQLWKARGTAEILIGSRYVEGGTAAMPFFRKLLSRVSNLLFSRGLDLHIRDMSSAFRLYKSQVLQTLTLESRDYEVLQEILVQALMAGYRIVEIPFHYHSRETAFSRAAYFGLSYLRAFARLWKLRNSIASADYDARAYDAMMPPQRYWQRQRYKIITALINENGQNKPVVDVGCGSSRIIGALPEGSLILDILLRKVRYARRFGKPAVQGSIFNLPVPDESFPCVLSSQVIEHIPRANVLDELDRVLQPGGFLILGTPDYGNWEWLVIEWLYKILLPQAYADEHITHYTYRELVDEFVSKRGYELEAASYILRGELILGLRKPGRK
ncbi:MAG TPA: methyltransferase domain-containing protein [Anaerolineales bacterium]|nr:methyltransferase domain-containing protein [Anaerolineales bacterium]